MSSGKTYSTKPKDIKREWHLVDVKGKVLGRVATQIAQLLIGKHKPYFTPHLDCGDYVVVVNAAQVKVTGKKKKKKVYYWHTGYPGGLKSLTFEQLMQKDPRKIIWYAVR
jgi:large subunit ribosomal protein L13